MAKRVENWTEIEARYKSGETPADIAREYRNCTAAKISQRAHRRGWKQEREQICNKIASDVLAATASELKELCNLTTRVHLRFMQEFFTADQDGETLFDKVAKQPFLLNGERHNPLFQTAMNNATKIMLTLYGRDEDSQKAANRIMVHFGKPADDPE